MPHTKSIPSYWRKIPQWYRLEGVVCKTCGNYYFPARSLCPVCRRRGKLEPYTFRGTGTIYSYTIVHAPPHGFELQKPYILAVIELDEGPRMTAQVVECSREELQVGARVRVVFRKIREDKEGGIILYGYKFKPIGDENETPESEEAETLAHA